MKPFFGIVLLGLSSLLFGGADELDSIPLFTRHGMLYLPVTITDRQGRESPVLFQMDTGSLGTFLDSRYFSQDQWTREGFETTILTQSGPNLSRERAVVSRLQVGGKAFLSLRLPVVTDLFDVVEVVQGGAEQRPVVGVIGADLLFSQSCTFSVARREFAWVETPPWQPDRSLEVFSLFGLGWYVRGPFPGLATPVSYLIDTGTFGVFVPQEYLDTWQSTSPRSWLRWADGRVTPFSDSVGIGTWGDPLNPDQPRRLHVLGIQGGSQVSLGTEVLSQWDLWFDIHGYMMADLHLKQTSPQDTQAFVAGVDKSVWGWETTPWGFRLGATGRIKWLLSWGDGTRLTPDLTLGDRLVSVNGVPWVPGPGNFGEQTYPSVRLTWERDGHVFETTLRRQEVTQP